MNAKARSAPRWCGWRFVIRRRGNRAGSRCRAGVYRRRAPAPPRVHASTASASPSRSRHSPPARPCSPRSWSRLFVGSRRRDSGARATGARLERQRNENADRDDGKVHQRFGDGQDRFVGSVNFHGSPRWRWRIAHGSPVDSPVWGVYNIAAGVRLAAHSSQVNPHALESRLGPHRYHHRVEHDVSDATVVNVALPALQADLHATITDVQWVIEAYTLLLGGLILVGGSMGDQFGRERVFLAGVAFFAASIFCGAANVGAWADGRPRVPGARRCLPGAGESCHPRCDVRRRRTWPGDRDVVRLQCDDVGDWAGRRRVATDVRQLASRVLPQRAARHNRLRSVLAVHGRKPDESRTGRVDWRGAILAVTGLCGVVFGLLEAPPLGMGTRW